MRSKCVYLFVAVTVVMGLLAGAAACAPAEKTVTVTETAPAITVTQTKTTTVTVTVTAAPEPIRWKMQSAWPGGPADLHHVCAEMVAERIERMSGGRIQIDLSVAGTIVPAFEIMDAVSTGVLDAGHVWPGYWVGKNSAFTLFASAAGGPYGMDALDWLGWFYKGGGLELYRELHDKMGYNVVGFATFPEIPEPQGWFAEPVTTLEQFKGLKFRAAGLAAEVFKELGMTVVTLPGGEIVPTLEKGAIDAAEFSDPSTDMSFGFQDVVKYYHLPGIHQPTGMMELLVNKDVWEGLPEDLKWIVDGACEATTLAAWAMWINQNVIDLEWLVEEAGVILVETPQEILLEVLKAWDVVAAREAAANPDFAKILESQKEFAARNVPYRRWAHPDYDLAGEYYWPKKKK
ncbi:MAG TPA: TRAP transporter substrate-binding protein [Dehalococcoidia bacterium]|jgi:TRAP-type mannitol/chloroaromatic compound transport system substrate-binding protein|nr:TRAP transporter substrate-binding protein [Dehalococcoidia bacterium]